MSEQKPLVFIDREGRPGGGERSVDQQRPDLHFEWIKAELAVVEVMVFQIRFQNILINDSGVFPTLEAGWSTGGCLTPKVMLWEERDGCLDADKCSHPKGKQEYCSND